MCVSRIHASRTVLVVNEADRESFPLISCFVGPLVGY